MGKRSTFERRPQDAYDTPKEAVEPLIPHLPYGAQFAEPCAGNGALVEALEDCNMSCVDAADIRPRASWIVWRDAMEEPFANNSADWIITNPPWTRAILHPMIERFSDLRPTWLLFDADWMHTRQSTPYLPRLRKIVSVGRVKWIPDSPHTGKDNCAWYLFTRPSDEPTQFFGRA